MFNKKNTGRIFGLLIAAFYGTLVGVILQGFGSWLSKSKLLLMCGVLGVGFYFLGIWIVVDRPAEINKKVPIGSKERRRRKKEFFDWLA